MKRENTWHNIAPGRRPRRKKFSFSRWRTNQNQLVSAHLYLKKKQNLSVFSRHVNAADIQQRRRKNKWMRFSQVFLISHGRKETNKFWFCLPQLFFSLFLIFQWWWKFSFLIYWSWSSRVRTKKNIMKRNFTIETNLILFDDCLSAEFCFSFALWPSGKFDLTQGRD